MLGMCIRLTITSFSVHSGKGVVTFEMMCAVRHGGCAFLGLVLFWYCVVGYRVFWMICIEVSLVLLHVWLIYLCMIW
jgi:hypothetical protein